MRHWQTVLGYINRTPKHIDVLCIYLQCVESVEKWFQHLININHIQANEWQTKEMMVRSIKVWIQRLKPEWYLICLRHLWLIPVRKLLFHLYSAVRSGHVVNSAPAGSLASVCYSRTLRQYHGSKLYYFRFLSYISHIYLKGVNLELHTFKFQLVTIHILHT